MQLQLLHYDISDCITISQRSSEQSFAITIILIVLITTNEACEVFCVMFYGFTAIMI